MTLDGSGTIVRVPAMPGCALEGRKAVDSYAVIEANDGVFVYFPSAERPEPCELKLPEEFSDPRWSSILCMSRWDCSYRFVYDNFADPMHACYLHADLFTLAFGAKQDVMQIEKRDDGFYIARVEQKDVNLDWTHVVVDGTQVYCRLDIPYPAAAGPGGPFRIIGYATPVDEKLLPGVLLALPEVTGIARESWRFLYRATLETRHWNVLEQDREMLTNIPSDAHKREMLYQHDVGVARMRRTLTQQVKQPARRRGGGLGPYRGVGDRHAGRANDRRDRCRARCGARHCARLRQGRRAARARRCASRGRARCRGRTREQRSAGAFRPDRSQRAAVHHGIRATMLRSARAESTASSTMRRSRPMSAASCSTRSISICGTA